MKKKDLLTYYNFLGNTVKMSSLSDKETRLEFIRFFRSLRTGATAIREDLNAILEKPFDDAKATAEAQAQVMQEEYEGDLPKIKDEVLLEVLAESASEVPVDVIISSFEPFFE